MKKFIVRVSLSAQNDIFYIIETIAHVYKAPRTAEKYLIQLYDVIFSLENTAESIAISTKKDVLKYGLNARSIAFKKLLIIYTVHSRIVLVQAVINAALIKE